ncbi:MAG: hypothetical protein ISS71_00165 [Phycisphaerae bacterium]|nr:hypothetical protein [Phycisphaerae bacterium]
MNTLTTFLSEETVRQIGWVLVHFLWQGCVVMALMWGILKTLSKASSNTRYIAAGLGLVLMVLAPVITFSITSSNHTIAVPGTVTTQPPAPSQLTTGTDDLSRRCFMRRQKS